MQLSPQEFAEWKASNKEFILIDIREEYEVALCSLGGKHVPMDQVAVTFETLPTNLPIIFHCNSGKRSDAVVYHLLQRYPDRSLYSLTGGVQGWAEAFDPAMKCSI